MKTLLHKHLLILIILLFSSSFLGASDIRNFVSIFSESENSYNSEMRDHDFSPEKKLPSAKTTTTCFYVSALTGNDANTGLSMDDPLKTIQTASNLTYPGDTVYLMEGIYATSGQTILYVTRSGDPDYWITYKALPGHRPKIKASGSIWSVVLIEADYIVFEGIEMEGDLMNIELSDAEAAQADAQAGGTDWYRYGTYNCGAITLGGNNSKGNHHAIVRNCIIHDFPGGGIQSIKMDYITIENNHVYNTSWYTMYAMSGISLWHVWNSDDETGYKIFVRGNLCHDNKTLVRWVGSDKYSDGNGIIIDDNKNTQDGAIGGPYTGRTLVENNICFNNGGSGIHAYSCSHVDIINNTTYHNGIVPQVAYPELFQGSCTDGKVMNNIIYARDGGKGNDNYNNSNVTYDYNIYFNTTPSKKGPNDLIADPMFVNLSLDPEVADFRLQPGSPAIDFGTSQIFAEKDFSGITRPLGNRVDAGAYESSFTNSVQGYNSKDEIIIWPNPASSHLQIKFPSGKEVYSFEVFNENGIPIISKTGLSGISFIDVSMFQQGFYLIRLNSSQGVISRVFVKTT